MSNFLEKKIKPILESIAQLIKGAESEELEMLMLPLLTDRAKDDLPQKMEGSFVIYGIPNKVEQVQIQQFLGETIIISDVNWADIDISVELSIENQNIPIRIQSWNTVDFYQLERQHRLSLTVLICQDAHSITGVLNHIQLLLEEIPFLSIYNAEAGLSETNIKSSLAKKAGILQIKKWTVLENEDLKKEISPLLSRPVNTALRNYITFQKVLKLTDILKQKTKQVQFNIQNKKQRIEQEIAKNSRLSKTNKNILLQGLKDKMNHRLTQFEKRFTQKLEHQLLPESGMISKKMEEKIITLAILESKKESKNILFHIPEDFNIDLFDLFKKEVLVYCLEEKKEGMTYVRAVEREVKVFLEEQNLPLLTKGHDFLDHKDIQNLIERKANLDRAFEGKVANKTFMQYFMGARMYFMIVMMAMSMLGLSSMLMRNRAFMIPPTILLVSLGAFQMWSSKQKEDAEHEKKHLAEAQTLLTNSLNKIMQDFCKTWEKILLLGVKENTLKLLKEAEFIFKTPPLQNKKNK